MPSRISARMKEFGESDAPELANAIGVPALRDVRERFARGCRCFGACVDEQAIAAYGWVSLQPEYIGEQERFIQIQSGEAYIWDCVTLPQYRGQRLYSALLSHANVVLYNETIERAFIGTALNNYASLRGFANSGFQPLIAVTTFQFWSLQLSWVRGQSNAPRELVNHARRAWIAQDERVIGPLMWRRL